MEGLPVNRAQSLGCRDGHAPGLPGFGSRFFMRKMPGHSLQTCCQVVRPSRTESYTRSYSLQCGPEWTLTEPPPNPTATTAGSSCRAAGLGKRGSDRNSSNRRSVFRHTINVLNAADAIPVFSPVNCTIVPCSLFGAKLMPYNRYRGCCH